MKSTAHKTIDAYIAAHCRKRCTMHSLKPCAQQCRPKAACPKLGKHSYNMPAFKPHDCRAAVFRWLGEHYAISPGSATALSELQDELGKSQGRQGHDQVRDEPRKVPVRLIARICQSSRAGECGPEGRESASAGDTSHDHQRSGHQGSGQDLGVLALLADRSGHFALSCAVI